MHSTLQAQELRKLGNECALEEEFDSAINFYTQALKLEPNNYILYSNRSYVYLKNKMYYNALQDAMEAIYLKSDWAKGYFRKAEVEYAIGKYVDSLVSYGYALKYQPDDPNILASILKVNRERKAQAKAMSQVPWLGAGFGIIIAVFLMVANHITCSTPFIKNPLLIVLTTILIAIFGYFCGLAVNEFKKYKQHQMLIPPKVPDTTNIITPTTTKFEPDVEQEKPITIKKEKTQRYSKAQARQRYKKGKF